MGLLEKSLKLSAQGVLSFFDFTQKYSLSYSAILTKKNNSFIITDSYGFDGDTILSSVSTQDFWDGTIAQKNKFYIFDEPNILRPFMQLLSDNLINKIKLICIYYTDDKILLIMDENSRPDFANDKLIEDFNLIVNEGSKTPAILNFTKNNDDFISLFRLSAEKSVEAYINKNLKNQEFKDVITQSINDAIYNKLRMHFSRPDYIFRYNKCSFNLVIVSKTQIPYDLIKKHLEQSLKEIISFYSESIDLSDYGHAGSYHELIEFIQAR